MDIGRVRGKYTVIKCILIQSKFNSIHKNIFMYGCHKKKNNRKNKNLRNSTEKKIQDARVFPMVVVRLTNHIDG